MADICGECLKLDLNNKERWSSVERYYCEELRRYVEPTDRACRYYSYNRNHNEKNNGGYTPSGCSFSIMIRDILGFADNCEMLNILRNFRENILKKNENFLPVLLEYDQISPLISESLEQDEDRYSFSLGFFQRFLLPFANAFKNGDIESSLLIYKNMFGELKERFGFNDIIINLNAEYDIETLGKGRLRQPKTSEI